MGFDNIYYTAIRKANDPHRENLEDMHEPEKRVRKELKPFDMPKRMPNHVDWDNEDSRTCFFQEIFDGEPARIYYHEFLQIMKQISLQFPKYIFAVEHDWSDGDASSPGRSFYYFHNGKFQDATPEFEPLDYDPAELEDIEEPEA